MTIETAKKSTGILTQGEDLTLIAVQLTTEIDYAHKKGDIKSLPIVTEDKLVILKSNCW